MEKYFFLTKQYYCSVNITFEANQCSLFIVARPNNLRAINRARKLFVPVAMKLTNVCTGHRELLAGHLACILCGAPHFGRSAKEMVFRFMFHKLFSWEDCPFELIQSRTPPLIFIPAGICVGKIYCFSEVQ